MFAPVNAVEGVEKVPLLLSFNLKLSISFNLFPHFNKSKGHIDPRCSKIASTTKDKATRECGKNQIDPTQKRTVKFLGSSGVPIILFENEFPLYLSFSCACVASITCGRINLHPLVKKSLHKFMKSNGEELVEVPLMPGEAFFVVLHKIFPVPRRDSLPFQCNALQCSN